MRTDEARIGENLFHGHARGQGIAVHIEDVSPAGFPQEKRLRIPFGDTLKFLVAQNLQFDQPRAQPRQDESEQRRQN